MLALVAGQDVEPAEDSDGTDGRWRIARRVAADRVISTVDTETRHTRKSKSARRDGFRGHVAMEPATGLITDAEMTAAAGEDGSDAVVGEKMIARDRYHSPPTTTTTTTTTDDRPSANARPRTRRPVRRPPPTVPVRIPITVWIPITMRCNRIPRRCPMRSVPVVSRPWSTRWSR